ncbi:MAG TPA: hypothetical protein VK660_04635 [Xanthomonadaceae bacterium]|nr:hypothetical protein [Xanthomonadaceae bacterium]
MNQQHCPTACLGLRARTARAIAIVVSGTTQSPQVVTRTQISLATADSPALFGPYHEVLQLPWGEAVVAVQAAQRAIEVLATRSLKRLLLDLRTQDIEVACIAVVGAPERNLQTIGSPHIRAHAAEGVLFRHVWEVAADTIGTPWTAFPEKGFEALASQRLGIPVETVRERLTEFGRTAGRPWRSDEKAAAMAAWLAIASRSTL